MADVRGKKRVTSVTRQHSRVCGCRDGAGGKGWPDTDLHEAGPGNIKQHDPLPHRCCPELPAVLLSQPHSCLPCHLSQSPFRLVSTTQCTQRLQHIASSALPACSTRATISTRPRLCTRTGLTRLAHPCSRTIATGLGSTRLASMTRTSVRLPSPPPSPTRPSTRTTSLPAVAPSTCLQRAFAAP